eukprot:232994-Chlamydomonas_euryale.AAC.1
MLSGGSGLEAVEGDAGDPSGAVPTARAALSSSRSSPPGVVAVAVPSPLRTRRPVPDLSSDVPETPTSAMGAPPSPFRGSGTMDRPCPFALDRRGS